MEFIAFFLGVVVGGAVVWAAMRAASAGGTQAVAEQRALLDDTAGHLREVFEALAGTALKSNNQAFLDLAKTTFEKFQTEAAGDLGTRQKAVETLVKPLREQIEKFGTQVREMERAREGAYGELREQVKSLASSQLRLQSETANLVNALRAPQVRGRWGELTLRRVVELAGMVEHCDFSEQTSVTDEEGKRRRPDMIVRLPNDRQIVVDAKVPLQAYLEALEAETDEAREAQMKRHADQLQAHMSGLAKKSYAEQFQPTPEFVVLFIPGESFLSAAHQLDPELSERGFESGVVLATPATLIALLKAVAFGWRQEQIAQSAREISDLGKQLYERLITLGGHFGDLGKSLAKSVKCYNEAVGSLESRVLVTARKFRELGVAPADEIAPQEPIDHTPRALDAPEIQGQLTEGEEE